MRKREGSFVQTCFSRENSLAIEKGRTNRFSRILERSFEIERIYDSRLVSLSLSLSSRPFHSLLRVSYRSHAELGNRDVSRSKNLERKDARVRGEKLGIVATKERKKRACSRFTIGPPASLTNTDLLHVFHSVLISAKDGPSFELVFTR